MNWTKLFGGYAGFLAILFSFHYGYLTFSDHENWFKYHDVSFVEVEGNSIVFRSTSEIFRKTDFEWEDTLFCNTDNGEGFMNITRQKSSLKGAETKSLNSVSWKYLEFFPRSSTCYLRTVATAILPYSITKSQVLIGSPFWIPRKGS